MNVDKKASRFKGGGLVTFYYAQNVKIRVSNATMKVANANASMSVW